MSLVRLNIKGISYSQTQSGAYALILSEVDGKRKLPIVIGAFEAQSIAIALEKEIEERLSIAGIEVLEARIGYLAYAQEIANAMLKRQQATAIVAARHKIVEGAVSMVEMALEELGKKQIIDLDDERKAAMVSNLMVILCGDKDASPVLNTGTLNH